MTTLVAVQASDAVVAPTARVRRTAMVAVDPARLLVTILAAIVATVTVIVAARLAVVDLWAATAADRADRRRITRGATTSEATIREVAGTHEVSILVVVTIGAASSVAAIPVVQRVTGVMALMTAGDRTIADDGPSVMRTGRMANAAAARTASADVVPLVTEVSNPTIDGATTAPMQIGTASRMPIVAGDQRIVAVTIVGPMTTSAADLTGIAGPDARPMTVGMIVAMVTETASLMVTEIGDRTIAEERITAPLKSAPSEGRGVRPAATTAVWTIGGRMTAVRVIAHLTEVFAVVETTVARAISDAAGRIVLSGRPVRCHPDWSRLTTSRSYPRATTRRHCRRRCGRSCVR
ncbi:hypothetical protein [Propionimicrobium sp. PCR01-08-3]|uniref:hypothetical protein n=1 Tax=Propionimicrobium sp. PCR01-08-3 TaxID=3052086 RepID=UPI00255C70C5|nr:hypothetical protein [Propionimicrobium sp. PCR01-08-3]WIY81839.1 hypothetical protein QQ658_09930 [Propionimicrobium sp. PCR01-08-3]